MQFTQKQITAILSDIAKQEDGFSQIMKMSLESIMLAERELHNATNEDLSNGFRPRRVFGRGKILELAVPRSRNGGFYPLLLSVIKDQQDEARKLVFSLYSSGLTTLQVGDIFEKIYGQHYCKSQISHMMDYAREEVSMWLERKLDAYYPIVYIDATFIYTRRDSSVSNEAYYTVLGVKMDKTREVLAVFNNPTESASQWQELFASLVTRGVEKVGLFVCDGLIGIENSINTVFPSAEIQLCVVHLQRSIINKVKPANKKEVGAQLKQIFSPLNVHKTINTAYNEFNIFINNWLKIYPSFKVYKQPRYYLYFNYFKYQNQQVRQMIYTTNWIERLNRDYKRVLKMRGAMPNAESVLLLLGNVAKTRNAYHFPIYQFNFCPLFEI